MVKFRANIVRTKIAFMRRVSCFPWKPLAKNHHLLPIRPSLLCTLPASHPKSSCLMTRDMTAEHFQSIGFCRANESDFSLAFSLLKKIFPAHWNVLCRPGVQFFSVSISFLPRSDRHKLVVLPLIRALFSPGLFLTLFWTHLLPTEGVDTR